MYRFETEAEINPELARALDAVRGLAEMNIRQLEEIRALKEELAVRDRTVAMMTRAGSKNLALVTKALAHVRARNAHLEDQLDLHGMWPGISS